MLSVCGRMSKPKPELAQQPCSPGPSHVLGQAAPPLGHPVSTGGQGFALLAGRKGVNGTTGATAQFTNLRTESSSADVGSKCSADDSVVYKFVSSTAIHIILGTTPEELVVAIVPGQAAPITKARRTYIDRLVRPTVPILSQMKSDFELKTSATPDADFHMSVVSETVGLEGSQSQASRFSATASMIQGGLGVATGKLDVAQGLNMVPGFAIVRVQRPSPPCQASTLAPPQLPFGGRRLPVSLSALIDVQVGKSPTMKSALRCLGSSRKRAADDSFGTESTAKKDKKRVSWGGVSIVQLPPQPTACVNPSIGYFLATFQDLYMVYPFGQSVAGFSSNLRKMLLDKLHLGEAPASVTSNMVYWVLSTFHVQLLESWDRSKWALAFEAAVKDVISKY